MYIALRTGHNSKNQRKRKREGAIRIDKSKRRRHSQKTEIEHTCNGRKERKNPRTRILQSPRKMETEEPEPEA